MKLTIGKDLNKVRAEAKEKIAGPGSMIIHLRKRMEAEQVRAGGVSSLLSAEAEIRGVTVMDLAETILSKPDELAEGELNRQRAVAALLATESVPEIEAMVKALSGDNF